MRSGLAGRRNVRNARRKIAGQIEERGIGVILAVENSEAGANNSLGIEGDKRFRSGARNHYTAYS